MERQIQVLVFTADVRVQVPPRPPKIKGHPSGCPFIFNWMGKGLEPISMQMSGGHLLAAGLDGGNSIFFTEGENVIKSRLTENIYSVDLFWWARRDLNPHVRSEH